MFLRNCFRQWLNLFFVNITGVVVFTILLQQWYLLAEGVGQSAGHLVGTIDTVVGVVLLAFGFAGFFARQEPHVQLLGAFPTQRLFQVMCNLVGIDKQAVHSAGDVARGYGVKPVGVYQRVAFNRLG